MQRETELFFDSIVREDRPVLDLLTADYTLRQRAARQALRHPERHRQRVPARDAAGVPPRPARPGQHPDADVGRRSHVAGAARQVGDGSAARHRRRRRRRRTCRRSTTRRRRSAASTLIDARAHGGAPQEPGVHVVPPRDRSARPRARELRRRPARGASRTTRCRSTRSAISTTARRWTGRRGLREALLKHSDVFLRSFTENLMTYALGRRVEYYRHAGDSRDHPRRREERQPHVGVRSGRRQQRRRSGWRTADTTHH